MGKRREVRSALGTKLFSNRKEKRSAKRFRNKIVLLWEREQKCESFSEQNCSVIGKKTEVRIVFETKLLSYGKERWSWNHFRNQIVLLWEREQKRKSISKENCSVIGKKTEVRSVFGTKLFSYGKEKRSASVLGTKLLSYEKEHWSGNHFRNQIVLLWEREQKRKSISKENCSVIGKKTEVRSVFGTKLFSYGKEKRSASVLGTKLFSYGKEKRSAKRLRNKIVLLWEREQKCESFSQQNCSVIGKKTEVRIVFETKLLSYGKERWSWNHFRNQIVLLWEREQKRKSFSKENCSVIGEKTEVRSVFGTKLFSYGKEKRSAKRFGNKIVL